MFIIARNYTYVAPGISVFKHAELAWEEFFSNVKEGRAVKVRMADDANISASWHPTEGFRFGLFS